MGSRRTFDIRGFAAAALWVTLVVASASPVTGQPVEDTRDERTGPRTTDAILAEAGLHPTDECLEFRRWKRLRIRKQRWQEAIRILSRRRPERLYGWLIGAREPPERAVAEAKRQRDCLLDALLEDAFDRGPSLRVQVQTDGESLESRIASGLESEAGRRRLRDELTVSHYRSALSQAYIWRRKFIFVGSPFNRVSQRAADACELRADATWKPERPRHVHCWRRILSPTEREREILSASSAPGLSRHHWGTEFDFFSLTPTDFAGDRIRADEYDWMTSNARGFGFFQPYRSHTATYMEERWHWSYYPIAQALTTFSSNHRDRVDAHLKAMWDRLESRFNAGADEPRRYFTHIRENWKPFMFDVFVPNFERGRRR